MPIYEEAFASIAAGATTENILSGATYRQSKKDRTLRAVAATVRDNAPAYGDLIVEVYIGQLRVGEFQAGLARTTGREVQAEDYVPINLVVPGGDEVVIKVQNADAAAAHSGLFGIMFDGF